MNEMKPEDVMSILEKMDFFQGQRAGRELWFEKPFEVQEQDIADFSRGIASIKGFIKVALVILREKDALNAELTQTIAELTQTIAEKTSLIEELQLGWSEDQERVRKILDEKDAEIERLNKERDEARRDVGVAERNHYESAKEVDRLRYICSCYALQYGTVRGQRETIKEIRDEAITEFEKRLKAHECLPEYPWDEPFVLAGCIDQIAKEMKGDQR